MTISKTLVKVLLYCLEIMLIDALICCTNNHE